MIVDDIELRFKASLEDVQVLDGFCSGTGNNRSDVMRDLLHQWAQKKWHEARMIHAVMASKPKSAE